MQPKKGEETSLLILIFCWSRSFPGFDELPVFMLIINIFPSLFLRSELALLSSHCHVNVCVSIYTHVYIHICIYMYIYVYIHMYTYILKNYFNISLTTMINQEVKNIKQDGTILILLYYRLDFISGLMLFRSLLWQNTSMKLSLLSCISLPWD